MSGVVEIEDVEASPSPQPQQQPPHLHPHSPSLHADSGSPHYSSPMHVQQSPRYESVAQSFPGPQLRQRSVAPPSGAVVEADRMRRLVRSLKTLDVYPKTEDEVSVKTRSGGMVSLLSFAIIAVLLLNELWAFLVPRTSHSILVDTRTGDKLSIHFDITFHALRCSETSLDVMDSSGASQVAVSKLIRRTRLDAHGRRIGSDDSYEDHAHDADSNDNAARANAALNPMLQALGLGFPPGMQAGPDTHVDQRGEGCRVAGTLHVNRVAGNVHVALGGRHGHAEHGAEGKGAGGGGGGGGDGHDHGHGHGGDGGHGSAQAHVHQFMVHELAQYNCSHTIHLFRFGEPLPGSRSGDGPLDGSSQIIPWGSHTANFQYFLKVIPTLYEDDHRRVDTNQLSATQHTQLISVQDAMGGGMQQQRIPGVFFVYDLSPFVIRVVQRRVPLSSFVTSVCATVGGVLTVAGVIDSMLYAGAKMANIASPIAKK